jgi:hypothetical protein
MTAKAPFKNVTQKKMWKTSYLGVHRSWRLLGIAVDRQYENTFNKNKHTTHKQQQTTQYKHDKKKGGYIHDRHHGNTLKKQKVQQTTNNTRHINTHHKQTEQKIKTNKATPTTIVASPPRACPDCRQARPPAPTPLVLVTEYVTSYDWGQCLGHWPDDGQDKLLEE